MRRAVFLAWHRRIALVFAPLMLLQALTGAALLFRDPLERAFHPAVSHGPVRPVSALAQAAQARGARLDRLFFPTSPGLPAMAQLSGVGGSAEYAALDPASGRIVRHGSVWAFPMEAALRWHYRLMTGAAGLAVVALGGLALLVICGAGLGFWWPVRGRWGKSLTINPRMPARIRLRHWHRSGGVVAAIMLSFSAATGLLLAAPDILSGAGGRPEVLPPPSAAQIDAAMALAQHTFPAARLRDVRFPRADRLDMNFLAPEQGPRAVHVVSVRLSRPEVLKAVPADRNPVLWMKVLPLHAGDAFGLAGRILLLLEALVLGALAVSGPVMWWQQRKLRK